MLLSKEFLAARLRMVWATLMAPVSPKNLRMSAILIGIYQLLLSHVLLFLFLLGLLHAEQMKTLLALDIEDQKDSGFYDMAPFGNQLRLRTASELVSLTEMLLYILTVTSSIYVLTAISLAAGIVKNRAQLLLPWLIVEFVFIVFAAVVVVWLQNERFVEKIGGKFCFFFLSYSVLFVDGMMWYIIHCYYQNLRAISKLQEIATVAIPCPPPGAIPYHFRRENMHLGSNGYKHILSDAPDGNY